MKTPAAFFPIALALGAMMLVPVAGVKAQDAREEGPTDIEKCQTIDKPGSYRLVNNLKTGPNASCLVITADFVAIDLAGFTITGGGSNTFPRVGAGIAAAPSSGRLVGIAVRNGSISGFSTGVNLFSADASIVGGLRVTGDGMMTINGITANEIVRGNTVFFIAGGPNEGVGITATGIVTGNFVSLSRVAEYEIGPGSTVIGNTAVGLDGTFPTRGFSVFCPSNVTDNTAINNPGGNIVLQTVGCTVTNNAAP
jgi:hypothetical protein